MHSILDPDKESILLLGMVFSSDQTVTTRTWARVLRSCPMHSTYSNVLVLMFACTVDDKHKDDYLFPGQHCTANYN